MEGMVKSFFICITKKANHKLFKKTESAQRETQATHTSDPEHSQLPISTFY